MANVALRNVRKTYAGGFEAIKGIEFDVGDGQFCVLVGPSGCGKSTLLRMVAGLESITGGEIDIGGRIVNAIEPADRDIAMVFQNYALYPHMSVYNNMAYGLRNRRMPEPEIDTRVQEAARILELGAMLERKPRQLSGGQRQRVAMGRAIVRQPKVFLFDEPLSNPDAKLRIAMRVETRKLQRRLSTTSIYVNHDQLEALTMAGSVALGLTVEAIERVGAETFIYGTRQHEAQGVAANPGELPPGEVIVRIPGAIGPAIGERIRAVAPPDKLHLFTADGRQRVGG